MRINPMGREGFVLALSFNNDWVFVLDPNWVMGATFGGYHVIAGIYLYFTEKKEPLA